MPTVNKFIDSLQKQLDKSVAKINASTIPAQKELFKRVVDLLKLLEVGSDGKILNNVQNILKISSLKSQINSAILNKDWIKSTGEFQNAFDVVAKLQTGYYSTLVADYTAPVVLDAIKNDAIKVVAEKLIGDGVKVNVASGIEDILRTNIKSGASFIDMMETMRSHILSDTTGQGALERYTQQITTDSLNQFSAVYNKAVTDDLGFDWYMYTGSLLDTSRQFCKMMVDKTYVHKSELQQIINGHQIDGKSYEVNSKTDLWKGAIAGTNPDNFQYNRGGWTCSHQFTAVPDAVVPEELRSKFI
jgi:hypothetical protein